MMLSAVTLMLVSAIAASAAPRQGSRPRVVVLGDSLASGRGIGTSNAFPAVLQEKLDQEGLRFEMVNAGISGDTSARALRRYEQLLDDHMRVLLSERGANDGMRRVATEQV